MSLTLCRTCKEPKSVAVHDGMCVSCGIEGADIAAVPAEAIDIRAVLNDTIHRRFVIAFGPGVLSNGVQEAEIVAALLAHPVIGPLLRGER